MLKAIAICGAVALALMSPATAQDVPPSADAATTVAAAGVVPQAVKDACKNDYEKHCSAHDPDGAAARDCMAHAFEKLSDPCVTAILDSPLVEQQQQEMAKAQASEPSGAEDAKAAAKVRNARSAQTSYNKTSRGKPHTKYAAVKTKRHVAHRTSRPQRSVAAHIRRGTGIASRYVAKYTRFAFAKAFR